MQGKITSVTTFFASAATPSSTTDSGQTSLTSDTATVTATSTTDYGQTLSTSDNATVTATGWSLVNSTRYTSLSTGFFRGIGKGARDIV